MLRCAGLDERDVRRVRLERDELGPARPRRLVGDRARRRPVERERPRPTLKSPTRSAAARPGCGSWPVQVVEADFPFLGACYGIGTLGTLGGGVVDRRYGEPIGAGRPIDAHRGRPGRPAARRAARAASPPSSATRRRCPGCRTVRSCWPRRPPARCRRSGWGSNVYATQFHPELDVARDHHPHRGLPSLRLLRAARGRRAWWHRSRGAVVTEPPRILARFVELYAR